MQRVNPSQKMDLRRKDLHELLRLCRGAAAGKRVNEREKGLGKMISRRTEGRHFRSRMLSQWKIEHVCVCVCVSRRGSS